MISGILVVHGLWRRNVEIPLHDKQMSLKSLVLFTVIIFRAYYILLLWFYICIHVYVLISSHNRHKSNIYSQVG